MEENINIERKFNTSISMTEYKIKDEIRKSSFPLVIKNINKQLPPDVIDEIPDESIYYKTV
ncbi:hypothetical protein H8356DRAFT_1331532 [Neocallimastix lanati (nom. inval.)]|nr:hypothetical protein H8356DRAFT_1331532 [Neocallimastix sp. JGI-2020a]